MFGSNDDKKTPAAAGEKKSLFGWLRKKPQEPVVEQPQRFNLSRFPQPYRRRASAGCAADCRAGAAADGRAGVCSRWLKPRRNLPLTPAHEPWLELAGGRRAGGTGRRCAAPTCDATDSSALRSPSPWRCRRSKPVVRRVSCRAYSVAPVASLLAARLLPQLRRSALCCACCRFETPVEAAQRRNQAGFFARLKQGLSQDQRQHRRRHGQPVPGQEGH